MLIKIKLYESFYIGVPKQLVQNKLKAPASCFMRNGDILMVKFVDKKASGDKEIYLVDSKGAAGMIEVERFEKGMRDNLLYITISVIIQRWCEKKIFQTVIDHRL